MQLIWLAKKHKMYKSSPKRNISKKKSNLMHTRHFHEHSLKEQAHLTKSVFYLICTIIGSICITFYFPHFFFLSFFAGNSYWPLCYCAQWPLCYCAQNQKQVEKLMSHSLLLLKYLYIYILPGIWRTPAVWRFILISSSPKSSQLLLQKFLQAHCPDIPILKHINPGISTWIFVVNIKESTFVFSHPKRTKLHVSIEDFYLFYKYIITVFPYTYGKTVFPLVFLSYETELVVANSIKLL